MRNLLLTLFLLPSIPLFGTHLKGGYIRIEHISYLRYKLTVIVFTNTAGPHALFGGADSILDFGDGSDADNDGKPGVTIPEQYDAELTDGIAIASYSTEHIYPAYSSYIVSFSEPNRNHGIINFPGSGDTKFYLESNLLSGPFLPHPYSSPEFLLPPIFQANTNSVYNYGVSAVDPNDYNLYYSVSAPGTTGYTIPSGFRINPYNGEISWETTGLLPGPYLFNIRIAQRSEDHFVGYTILEFQVTLLEENSSSSIRTGEALDANRRIYVPEGAIKNWRVFYEESEETGLSLQVRSKPELTTIFYDSVSGNKKIKACLISFKHDEALTRFNPYIVTVRGTSAPTGSTNEEKRDMTFMIYTQDVDISDNITGAETPRGRDFLLYPNPFEKMIWIGSNTDQTCHVTIRTTGNILIYDGYVKNGDLIDLADLSPGVLIYQIRLQNKVVTGKMVKRP